MRKTQYKHIIKKPVKPPLKKKSLFLITIAFLLFFSGALLTGKKLFFSSLPNGREKAVEAYENLLTEKEQKAWRETPLEAGNAFIQLDTKALLSKDGKSVKLHLVNPPYSDLHFQIVLKLEKGEILYKSPVVKPGTLVEEIPLGLMLKQEEHSATVEYSFFDSRGKEQKKYNLDVTITPHLSN